MRSIRVRPDTTHEVKLRPLIRRTSRSTRGKGTGLSVLALALALAGCGSREDLIIGINDFTLERRDDFDGPDLDLDYWELATHTFEPNLAFLSNPNTWPRPHPLLNQSPSRAEIRDGRSRPRTPITRVRRGC